MDLQFFSGAPFFLLCGFTKKDVNDKLKMITALGGRCENTKKFIVNCSHVICKQPVQSEIFLGACLTGKWVLMPKYIQDCYEQQCWLKEDGYEWESKFITDCSSSLERDLYNAPKRHRMYIGQNGCEMFRGWRVALLIDDQKKSSRYTRLLELGNAEIINPFASSAPDVAAGITHVFFEGLKFHQLFVLKDSIFLRPEYIDCCIVEVTLPDTQLFEIVLPTTSDEIIKYPFTETMERTVGADTSTDYQKSDRCNNTTLMEVDSISPDMNRTDPIHCEQEINNTEMEKTQLHHVHYKNKLFNLPFSNTYTRILQSDIMEHNKGFNSNRNIIMEPSTKEIENPTFDEVGMDTYQLHEDYAPTKKSIGKSDLVDTFSEGSSNINYENTEISSTLAWDYENDGNTEESKTCKDGIAFSRKHLNMNGSKTVDADKFCETLKLVNEKSRSKKIPFVYNKAQSVITSYFLESNKKSCTKRKLISGECDDCDEWKVSSTQSNICKTPKILRDDKTLCNENSYAIKTETLNQADIVSHQNDEIDLHLVDNRLETMKNEPDNHQRHCNITQLLKNKFDNNKKAYSSMVSDDLTSLVDVCLEEDDPCIALDMVESLVCTCYHPHPRMLNSLMFRILQCSFDERISNRTFIILHRIFHLHPPGYNDLGQYYLDAFSLCGKEIVSPWFVLSEIIRKCVQHNISCSRNTLEAEYLLSFVIDIISYNFNDFKFRNKYPRKIFLERKKLLPIVVKIFWPTDSKHSGTMNGQCKELFQHIYELLVCNVKPDYMFKTLLSLQKLIGIIAECSVFFDPGTQSNVYNRSRTQALATNLLSAVQDPLRYNNTLLNLFLETMQCTWLRMLFCQKFLDQNTSSLNSISAGDNCLTLETIVDDYMQRSPPSYKYRLRNHSSFTAPKAKQLPGKIKIKCENSKQQKSSESYLSINKRDSKGETKLHIACKHGKDEDVKKLLTVSGIDLNIQDNAGWTPLHEACLKGDSKCVKLLLEWDPPDNDDRKRVNLMTQAENGITPLHDAVLSNNLEIADLLLKQGGRRLLEKCTKDGYTACDMAKSNEMYQLLTSALDYPYKDLSIEVIEISSESDADDDHSSELNVYQHLFLIYHMLVSYLTVYRIDEMMEQLKHMLEKEGKMMQFENKSYCSHTAHSYNMQVISKAVCNILSNDKSCYTPQELDARKRDLCFALNLSNIVEKLLKHTDPTVSLESNTKVVRMALECLCLKYKL